MAHTVYSYLYILPVYSVELSTCSAATVVFKVRLVVLTNCRSEGLLTLAT